MPIVVNKSITITILKSSLEYPNKPLRESIFCHANWQVDLTMGNPFDFSLWLNYAFG
jgi:hypothetical protein